METTLEENRTIKRQAQISWIRQIEADQKISDNQLNQLNRRSIATGRIVAISIKVYQIFDPVRLPKTLQQNF